MADKSAIEWTDATWNPTVGCSLVSPGCTNCYAMKQAHRFSTTPGSKFHGLTTMTKGGPVWNGAVRLDENVLDQPLRWRRPRRVFVNSMSDLFHESLPDDAIDQVFAVMALCPQHTFQVLTKRGRRMRDYLLSRSQSDAHGFPAEDIRVVMTAAASPAGKYAKAITWPMANVWLGVSVEDQARAEERIPLLLDTPASVRFISAEPLLGPIDIGVHLRSSAARPAIDWVIVGGESGPGARPFPVYAARSIIEQCKSSGVAVFMKQMGAVQVYGTIPCSDLKDRKGGDPAAWPVDLRVREFPR